MSIGAFRCDRETVCKAMNVMHMSLITTLHLSHGHVVTTILHSVAAVHGGTPYPLLHAFAAQAGVVGDAWVHGGVGSSGRRGVGLLPSLAAHFVAPIPGPPQHRSELLLG